MIRSYRAWGGTVNHYVDVPGYGMTFVDPVEKHQLPPFIFHVTPWINEIQDTGLILAHGGADRGGLGGGTRLPGVSFTTSLERALVIMRELLRVGQIARGEVDPSVLRRWAEEDERYFSVPRGTFTRHVIQALERNHPILQTRPKPPSMMTDEERQIGRASCRERGGIAEDVGAFNDKMRR